MKKKIGNFMMYIPFVWYIGWLFAMYTFVYTNMDVNPAGYIMSVFYITIYPPTWITVILGIWGYFLQRD